MNHDADSSDIGDVPSDRATIQLWRAPNRMWPVFPTLVLIRAASRLGGDRAKRQKSAIGEGGVVTVFLDGSKVGTISPQADPEVSGSSRGTFAESPFSRRLATIAETWSFCSRGR